MRESLKLERMRGATSPKTREARVLASEKQATMADVGLPHLAPHRRRLALGHVVASGASNSLCRHRAELEPQPKLSRKGDLCWLSLNLS